MRARTGSYSRRATIRTDQGCPQRCALHPDLSPQNPGARAVDVCWIPHEAETAGEDSLYGLKPESIVEKLENENLRSWSEFDEYSQTMLEVGLNVPVRYPPKWIPSDVKSRVSGLEKQLDEADFTVMYDGTDLRKPTVLRGPEGYFLRRFSFEGEHVSATGYFFAKRRALTPQELNGVLIRIRRAAVGEYDSSWLDYRASPSTLYFKVGYRPRYGQTMDLRMRSILIVVPCV